jgi:hypothetical protein
MGTLAVFVPVMLHPNLRRKVIRRLQTLGFANFFPPPAVLNFQKMNTLP